MEGEDLSRNFYSQNLQSRACHRIEMIHTFYSPIKSFTSKYCWCRLDTCWDFQFLVSWNKELDQRYMDGDRNRNGLLKRRKALLSVGGNRPEIWERWEALMTHHLLRWAFFSRSRWGHCLSMLSFVPCSPIWKRFPGLLPSAFFPGLEFIVIQFYCQKRAAASWSWLHTRKVSLTLPQDSVDVAVLLCYL